MISILLHTCALGSTSSKCVISWNLLSYQLSDICLCYLISIEHIMISEICFQINHQIVRDSDLFSLFMGLICSRRSRSTPVAPPIAAPLLPAAVIAQIQSFNQLPESTIRAHRRWRRSIRRIITLLRLRKIWASLGRYLNDQACGQIFGHLQRRNGQIGYRIDRSAASRP